MELCSDCSDRPCETKYFLFLIELSQYSVSYHISLYHGDTLSFVDPDDFFLRNTNKTYTLRLAFPAIGFRVDSARRHQTFLDSVDFDFEAAK